MGLYSADWDLLITQQLLEPFVEELIDFLFSKDIFVQKRQYVLKEYPKEDQLYFHIKFEEGLKLGITGFEGNIENELSTKDFTINSLCYDIVKRNYYESKFYREAL